MSCLYTHVLCIYTCLVHIHMSCPYTHVLSLYTCVFRIHMSCPLAHVYRKTWSRLLSLLPYSFVRLSVHFFLHRRAFCSCDLIWCLSLLLNLFNYGQKTDFVDRCLYFFFWSLYCLSIDLLRLPPPLKLVAMI
jgi:hypothetical protein